MKLESQPTSTTSKRAGRRPKNLQEVSREAMIGCAIRIAKSESLGEVSMVRVGKELGVAPGMVHYHLGSRDKLVSAVINAAFKERVQRLPATTGDWRIDLENFTHSSLTSLEHWPGLATYILTENKFRLFQRVRPEETDYGMVLFNHVGQILQGSGMRAPLAAMAYHLLALFTSVIAAEKENRQEPHLHRDFINDYIEKSGSDLYPGAAFLAASFTGIDSASTLDAGLRLLLETFQQWRVTAA